MISIEERRRLLGQNKPPEEEVEKGEKLSRIEKPYDLNLKEIGSIQDAISIAEKHPEDVLRYLSSALKAPIPPPPEDHFDALLAMGKIHHFCGTPDAFKCAKEKLEEAENLIPQIDSPEKIADCYRYLALVTVGDDPKKQNYFELSWKAHKSSSLAIDYIKFLKNDKKDFLKALEICNEALKEDPHLVKLLRIRARLHLLSGLWVKAYQDWQSCLAVEPDLFQRVEILRVAVKKSTAARSDEVAIKFLDELSLLEYVEEKRVKWSRKLLNLRLLQAPVTVFTHEMVELDGDRRLDIIRLPEDSFSIFDSLPPLFKAPKDLFWILLARAITCIQSKVPERLPSARENLQLALHIIEEHSAAFDKETISFNRGLTLRWMAELCIKMGDSEEGLKHFQKGWDESGPHCAPLFAAYAQFLVGQDREKALDLIEEADQVMPDHCICHYVSGKVHFALKHWDKAGQNFAAVLANPMGLMIRLEVLKLMKEICIQTKDYSFRRYYAKMIYEETTTVEIVEQFEEYCTADEILLDETSPPSLIPMCRVARDLLKNGKKQDAFTVYSHIPESTRESLEAILELAQTQTELEKGDSQKFPLIWQELGEVYGKLPQDPYVQFRYFYCRALLHVKQNRGSVGENDFKEAFNITEEREHNIEPIEIWHFLIDYIVCLAKQGKVKQAEKLSKDRDDQLLIAILKTHLFAASKNENETIKQCDSVIAQQKEKKREELKGLISSVLDLGLEAALKARNYLKAEQFAAAALTLGSLHSFPTLLKKLLEVHRERIVDEHLAKLCRNAGQNSYVSLLLKTYQTELDKHPKHHTDLLMKLKKAQQPNHEADDEDAFILPVEDTEKKTDR